MSACVMRGWGGAQNVYMPFHDSDKMVSELLKFIPARVNVLTSL